MRRNRLELICAGVAAILVAGALLFVDGFRRRVEFAAATAGFVER